MTHIVHQLKGSLNTQLHQQINSLKDYLSLNLDDWCRRHIDLVDGGIQDAVQYTKDEMEKYMSVL